MRKDKRTEARRLAEHKDQERKKEREGPTYIRPKRKPSNVGKKPK